MMFTCEWCGATIPPKVPGTAGRQRKRFCEENCRKRAWDATQAPLTCDGCGGPRSRHAERCLSCEKAVKRRAQDAQAEDVAEMYNAGMSIKEIGRELGYGEHSIPGRALDNARALGLIDYRYGAYAKDGGYQAIRTSVIEGCWADGWSMKEIAEVCGMNYRAGAAHITTLRANGANLPHRYAMRDGKRVAA